MTVNGWLQIIVYLAVILAVTKPMGVFMARVFNRERTFLDPVLRPVERLLYRLTLVDEEHEMRWTEYAVAMLLFSGVSMLVLYLIERTQQILPLNPQKFAAVGADLAFNTAASFTTNTNWQNYGGEATMSYLTQMAGLAYHNFASAAVGIALAIAFIRGIARREKETIGNFWVDLTRDHALGAAAGLHRLCAAPGLARRGAELETVRHGQTGRTAAGAKGHGRQTGCRHRRQAGDGHSHRPDDRARPGRFPGSHQGVGHQRRRILQRQQRASVREPHAAQQSICRCFPSSRFRPG